MGHGRVVAAAVGVFLAFPTAAAAVGSLERNGPTRVVTYTGDNTGEMIAVLTGTDSSGGGMPAYRFTPDTIVTNSGCTSNSSGHKICPSDSERFVFNMADGNDFVVITTFTMGLVSRPTTMNGGLGNDTLDGGTVDDTINGDDGSDIIRMYTGGGTANGGPGDDRFEHLEGPALFIGGPGTDVAHIDTTGPWNITLDGVANDGPANANIDTTVENVNGHNIEGDTITGSAVANVINGNGGNDTLDGKGGADTVNGGEGTDTIEARDGVADTINCGDGNDTANTDFRDTRIGCELGIQLPQDDDGDGSSPPAD